MSAEPTPTPHAPPDVTGPGADFHYTPGQRRLAILSYGLACAGPLAFWVLALFYPQRDARALPWLPIQAIWWLLRLSAPVGAILGLIVVWRSRGQTLGYRRMGVSYAGAGLLVGTLAALFLPYGTHVLNERRWENSSGQYLEGTCLVNLQQLRDGISLYAQDYDDHYPESATWNKTILPYASTSEESTSYTKNSSPSDVKIQPELLHCPEAPPNETRSTYAMFQHLQDVNADAVDGREQTPMVFDSVPGDNLVGGKELFPNPPRHYEWNLVACVDGHVKRVRPEEVADLWWNPKRLTQPNEHKSPTTKDSGTPNP